jgi:hypothetical protein
MAFFSHKSGIKLPIYPGRSGTPFSVTAQKLEKNTKQPSWHNLCLKGAVSGDIGTSCGAWYESSRHSQNGWSGRSLPSSRHRPSRSCRLPEKIQETLMSSYSHDRRSGEERRSIQERRLAVESSRLDDTERRSGLDRRSGAGRRVLERRAGAGRRSGEDRRMFSDSNYGGPERRSGVERRSGWDRRRIPRVKVL